MSSDCRGKVGIGSFSIETLPDKNVKNCVVRNSYDQSIIVESINFPYGFIHYRATNPKNVDLRKRTSKKNIQPRHKHSTSESIKIVPTASPDSLGSFDIELYHTDKPKYPKDDVWSLGSTDVIEIEIKIK